MCADIAQLVERVIGNDEVPGPNPGISSSIPSQFRCRDKKPRQRLGFLLLQAIFQKNQIAVDALFQMAIINRF